MKKENCHSLDERYSLHPLWHIQLQGHLKGVEDSEDPGKHWSVIEKSEQSKCPGEAQ